MAETEVSIPDELKWSHDDAVEASKRKQLAPGHYRFIITEAQRTVSAEKGTMMIQCTCTPLKDPNDADSKSGPTVRHNIIIPLANPDKPGHVAPNSAGLCHAFYLAIDEDSLPDYPRYDKESKTYEFKGQEIDKDEVDDARIEVTEALMERLSADWSEPQNLLDFAFFAEVYDNKGFTNLRNISGEEPEGVVLSIPGAAKKDEPKQETKGTKGRGASRDQGKAQPAAKKAANTKRK